MIRKKVYMKKGSCLFFVLFILLCQTSIALSKGTVLDFDAYEAYYGRTKMQVQLISPNMEQVHDYYVVDSVSRSINDTILLTVHFNDKDVVDLVDVFFPNETLSTMEIEDSIQGAFFLGINVMGFSYKMITSETETEEGWFAAFDNGAICLAEFSNGLYDVRCASAEDYLPIVLGMDEVEINNPPINTGMSIITLLETKFESDVLITTFSVENSSDHQISISQLGFEAHDSKGTRLQVERLGCPEKKLEGHIDPGEKMIGNLCWKHAENTPIELTYQPRVWLDEIFSFGTIGDKASNPEYVPPVVSLSEPIAVGDYLTITCSSCSADSIEQVNGEYIIHFRFNVDDSGSLPTYDASGKLSSYHFFDKIQINAFQGNEKLELQKDIYNVYNLISIIIPNTYSVAQAKFILHNLTDDIVVSFCEIDDLDNCKPTASWVIPIAGRTDGLVSANTSTSNNVENVGSNPNETDNTIKGENQWVINNPYDIGSVFRKKPSLNGEVIMTLKNGTKVIPLGEKKEADKFLWIKVQTENGIIGWINNAHVRSK